MRTMNHKQNWKLCGIYYHLACFNQIILGNHVMFLPDDLKGSLKSTVQQHFYEKDCFDANSLRRIKSIYSWSLKFSLTKNIELIVYYL